MAGASRTHTSGHRTQHAGIGLRGAISSLRVLWIATAGLLLCLVAAIPVPVAIGALPGETSGALDEPRAYDGHLVSPELGRLEFEERQQEEWLASDEAVEERQDSEVAYTSISPSESESLLHEVFVAQLEVLNRDPARFLSDARILRSLDTSAATVEDDGKTSLLDANVPIRAEDEDGTLAKVDLSLQPFEGGFVTDNALSSVVLPESADEGTEVGSEGFSIVQADANSEADASQFGDKNLFYFNVLRDTDLLVSPIASGVELFNLLRSKESPEDLRFHLNLPAGSVIRSDELGSVEAVRDDQTLIRISAPSAVDAQGTEVPLDLRIDGGDLILHVAHRANDYAYPILADPIVEDWANANWYSGQNSWALTSGAWKWKSNNGNIVNQVCCWGGKYMGLMINMKAAFYGPEQRGQWSYSTPNLNSYIEHAWITPFWRADYTCGAAQPHDYIGFLKEPGEAWNPVKSNEALKGATSLSGYGHGFVIGMGSGPPGVWSACDRNLYAGGVALWLNDTNAPVWNAKPGIPDTWTDTEGLPVSAWGSDAGLGIKSFTLYTTDSTGKAQTTIKSAVHGCTGLYGSSCPGSWALQFGNYSAGWLPTGVNPLVVIGWDAVGHVSQGEPVFLKVDHNAPTINWSGELLTPTPKKFHLDVVVGDGNSASLATAQSGVKSVEVFLDGQFAKQYPETANPPACSNVQEGRNLGSCKFEFPLDLDRALSGKHTIKVVAKDSLNHPEIKSLEVNLPADVTPPQITASGALYAASGGWIANSSSTVTVEALDSETGVAEESIYIDGILKGQASNEACFFGGCSMTRQFSVSLNGYSQGPHTVKVVAKDRAGKIGQATWTVNVDQDAPIINPPTTSPSVTASWMPQVSSVKVDFKAIDNGAGVKTIQLEKPVLGGGSVSSNVYTSSCSGLPAMPCSGPAEGSVTINSGTLPQASNVVTLTAFDAFGHASSKRSITINVDRDPPKPVVSGPLFSSGGGTPVGTSSVVSLSVSDKGGGVGETEFLVDGELEESLTSAEIMADGGAEPCNGETCQLIYSYAPEIGPSVASGTHNVSLVVKDRAGHAATITNAVTIDGRPPEVHLTGELQEAAGHVLEGSSGGVHIEAEDVADPVGSGINSISVAVDGVTVQSSGSCANLPCPAKASADYLFKKIDWGNGPHHVSVTATDRAGNSQSRVIPVDMPISAVAPPCPDPNPSSLPVSAPVSASQARQAVEEVVPEAFLPNVPPSIEAEEASEREEREASLAPVLVPSENPSIDPQGLDVQGSPVGGGVASEPAGSFTVGQAICMAPLHTTSAESVPATPNGAAAVYANSAPATDTVIRPNVAGTTIIQNIRGPQAPDEFAWEIGLHPGEELRYLEDGAVVVVQPDGVNVDDVDTSEIPIPSGGLEDVESQIALAQAELGEANNEIDGEVVAVISPPVAIGDNGKTVSALLNIGPVNVVTATLPPNTIADLEAMIIAANAPWEPEALCAQAFWVNPSLYAEGCSDPYDPDLTQPTSPPPGEEFRISDLRFPGDSAMESDWQGALSGAGASVSAAGGAQNASKWDKEWCYSDPQRTYACIFFNRDRYLAAGTEYGLFNVPSDDTKANAFRHAFWTALMVGEDEVTDAMAIDFVMNHERGQEASKNWRHNYKAGMDILNNLVGYRFEHFSSGHSLLTTCQHFVGKVGGSNFIDFNENPIRWANRAQFGAHNLVYRRKTEQGITVRLVRQDCVVAMYIGGVGVGY